MADTPDKLEAVDTEGNLVRPGRLLFDAETIRSRVQTLADDILSAYAQEDEVLIVAVMTGSMMFLADLVRAMRRPMRIGIIVVSSYPGTATQSHHVELLYETHDNLNGRHVLIVDDILDTGKTLSAVVDSIRARNPASVRTCVLLRKNISRSHPVTPEFIGFDIDDDFVVGYGLDYDDLYRNYPAIAVLDIKAHDER